MSSLKSVAAEIARAAANLGLSTVEFGVVDDAFAKSMLAEIQMRFVGRTDLRWWWEAFEVKPAGSISFASGQGWQYLTAIAPTATERVWFVAEDIHEFALYHSTVEGIQAVIGECYGFEYYVVAKDLTWIICENHHDVVIAAGDGVVDKLRALAAQLQLPLSGA